MQLQKAKYWIVLMVASLLVACSGSGPESAAEKIFSSAVAGDVDATLQMVHLDEAKSGVRERFVREIKEIPAEVEEGGGVKSIKALGVEYSDDKQEAEVEIEVKLGNGRANTKTVSLRKINGNWKMLL